MESRFDYYYGNETEQFRYYQIPKELLDNPSFSSLSLDAKILYAVLRDRMQLSKANSWIDEKQRVYIIYSIESIAQKLGIGTDKSIHLLKELEQFGLVEKKRRGQGMNSLLYIICFVICIKYAPSCDLYIRNNKNHMNKPDLCVTTSPAHGI